MPRRQDFTAILPVSGLLSSFCHFVYCVPGTLEGKALHSHLFQWIIHLISSLGYLCSGVCFFVLEFEFFKIILVVDFLIYFKCIRVGTSYNFSLLKLNDFCCSFFVRHKQSMLKNVLWVFWKNCILSALDRIFLSQFSSIILILIPWPKALGRWFHLTFPPHSFFLGGGVVFRDRMSP